MASLGLYTYLAEVTSARGMAAFTHAFIWLWGLGGMIGALLIGRIIDRHLPPARATLILLVLLGAGFVLVGWGSVSAAGLGCFLWGLAGWASVAPQQHALVTHDDAHATAALAWNSSVNYLGGAIGAAAGSMALHADFPAQLLAIGALVSVVVAILMHLAKLYRHWNQGAAKMQA
jgi:predicted MFS family arabinose efflux permease